MAEEFKYGQEGLRLMKKTAELNALVFPRSNKLAIQELVPVVALVPLVKHLLSTFVNTIIIIVLLE